MKVLIIGGGIAGLVSAYQLKRQCSNIEIIIAEKTQRTGGLIRTERTKEGFLIEHGPDGILTTKYDLSSLINRLHLQSHTIVTNHRHSGAYIARHNSLVRIPKGLNLFAPARPWTFLNSPLLSFQGKMRSAVEIFLPVTKQNKDESIGDFIQRRFGYELLERIAEPMMAGIYGSDLHALSLDSTLPEFSAIKNKSSITLSFMKKKDSHSIEGARYRQFISFDGGMEMFTQALSKKSTILTNKAAINITTCSNGYQTILNNESIQTDGVIITSPAYQAASLVRSFAPILGDELTSITYHSSVIATFAWKRSDIPHPLQGYGFLVPKIEEGFTLASTFSSVKWPKRAPEGWALIRVFLGGKGKEDILSYSTSTLEKIALRSLKRWLGIKNKPSLSRMDYYNNSMPQYKVSHAWRIKRIRDITANIPGLELAGSYMDGVGIPNTIKSANKAVRQLTTSLYV